MTYIGKHIGNVLTELSFHLPEKEATAVKDIIHCTIGGKDIKCTFDYRCAHIILASKSSTIIFSNLVQQLLTTLVEIQRIAYSSEAERSPKSVLRLHNMTWYHGILCREIFGFMLKALITCTLYGNYYHITCHAAVQHKVINGKDSTPSLTLRRLHPFTTQVISETFSLDCKLRKRCGFYVTLSKNCLFLNLHHQYLHMEIPLSVES
jgi:hypothetical protein